MNYLIKNTTKEEREEYVKKALLISLADCDMPSEYVLKLVKEYIDGKKEIDEIKKLVIKEYKDNE